MWSDILSKPKQGTPFRVFRSALDNVSENYDDDEEHNNTYPALLLKYGGGAVNATMLKYIKGGHMNKK